MMSLLRSKFRGCLLGALFGDALGALFEGEYWEVPVPPHRFDELSAEKLCSRKASGELLNYTDDTAMTKALCRSLVSKESFNASDLANMFVDEYFREPLRGYGSGVVTVFEKLRPGKHEDVTIPAREQFNGTGSYGNGAAMRVSPLALFHYNDWKNLIKDSKQSALITHAHILGINGAILQAVAVYEALNIDPGNLDVTKFIDRLIKTAESLERNSEESSEEKNSKTEQSQDSRDGNKLDKKHSYVTQFQHIKRMLSDQKGSLEYEEVIKILGHGIAAVEAVPAALFSFLHKHNTSFKDAVFYAISLGGDTDTIASMTGAIAGAYWGNQCIPEEWFGATESVDEVKQFADKLYDLRVKK